MSSVTSVSSTLVVSMGPAQSHGPVSARKVGEVRCATRTSTFAPTIVRVTMEPRVSTLVGTTRAHVRLVTLAETARFEWSTLVTSFHAETEENAR